MSLWSRDHLRIALAPGGLALLRHNGQPDKPLASKSVVSEGRDWPSLMPLLEHELADPAWRASHVEVVLSNHYVRYVLTSPPGKALSRIEEDALVAASFREIYGNETANWRMRTQSQPPQFGLVGAAIDEALAVQLGSVFVRHQYANWALNPLATLAAQRNPQRLADWWVLVEPGWACLFNAVGGYWRYLSSQPLDETWREHLPAMLEREARMAGGAPGDQPLRAIIQSVGAGNGALPTTPGWNWQMAPQRSEYGVLALATG